ncbi:D-alanyl-D-alanine carboxypeptidase [Streptomyces sp. TRM68416]|nr:D-alanyl-D-alanine carboxypeptidase [Streptomyces sp. TRM68416]MBD0844306.1 D-alanyl-D-alanine carboxypeptidase [Streptomyces sp. TRM68416]
MAGESPDRSKQRESSAEPTSGSAGPVPEARAEKNDPRLVMARGGVDTATRILSASDLAEARRANATAEPRAAAEPTGAEGPEDAEEATADTEDPRNSEQRPEAPEPESAEKPKDDTEPTTTEESEAPEASTDAEEATTPEGDKDGDDRLRAAVAAWVTSGGEKAPGEPAEARDEPEDDSEPAETPRTPDRAATTATDDKADVKAEDEDQADDEADADNAPEAAAKPDATDAKPDATDAKSDAKPEAADGEEAPQGPPAPDDESRTGGAGGNDDKAEGEAEAAVDHPTTTFRAVRPPAVDQPTSKFVALKPDIPAKQDRPTPPDVTTAVPQVGPERTTQQPLPPKPPLDLLAELTNTPPPPDTPVRTAVRRVKIWTPLVLLLAVVFAIVQAVRPLPTPTLDLTAKSSYTFEGGEVDIPWPTSGQAALDVQGIGSFGSSGEQKPVPIASVAKVMTAYVILRDHPLKSGAEGPNLKIDQTAESEATAEGESTVPVTAGDEISQREALESILIASANNVARLLARWDAGSEKAFVEKMNAAAEDLGMTNTTYTDPSGLNNTTVSTAVDQMKLAKAAMEDPAFREIAAMMSYDDYKGRNHGNWNQLVGKNNVVGIKTGTTTSALGNLMFAAKQEVGGETRTIVGAVLRQPDVGGGILAAALDSGDKLMRAAQDALESATLLKKGDVVGYVDDGLGGRTAVVATKDVKAAGWAGLKVELDFKAGDVPHSAKAGTKIGTLTVGDGGTAGAVKVPVALETDLVEPGFTDKLTRLG